jgi:hypothetical protein
MIGDEKYEQQPPLKEAVVKSFKEGDRIRLRNALSESIQPFDFVFYESFVDREGFIPIVGWGKVFCNDVNFVKCNE